MKLISSDRLVNGAFILCALGIVGVYATVHLDRRVSGVPDEPPEGLVDNWSEIRLAGHLVGRADAPVVIVELGDYQCPACRTFHGVLGRLREQLGDSVSLRYVHFPLPTNRWGLPAARAAECARAQGQFPAYHDLLYSTNNPLDNDELRGLAVTATVRDSARFAACATDTVAVEAITNGIALGHAVSLRRTPTLFVNGWRVNGAPTYERLERIVRRALKRQLAAAR
jgi:protein-disulfide isomerase